MMKTIITLLLFSFTALCFGQQSGTYLGARIGRLDIDGYTPRNVGGLELDVEFENNFGIQYTIQAGKNYFHMPLGPPVGVLAGLIIQNPNASDSTDSRVGLGILIGLIGALIPESFSYNISVNDQFSIAPFISPLQLEYIKNSNQSEGDWYAGGGIGARFHIYQNYGKFRLSPFFEYKIHYDRDIHKGFVVGACLSLRVGKKE